MTKSHKCVENVRHSNVTVSDRGSKYKANFPNACKSKFQKVRVDNCLITDGPRADWIVTKVGVGSAIVEIKGKDIDHAFKQLIATLKHESCKDHLEDRRALLVVCNRNPSFDSVTAKYATEARKNGVRLTTKCGGGDFTVEGLLGMKGD